MENELEKVNIGSGDLYVLEFTGAIPENEVIEIDDNLIGRIQGGATIEYKPKYYSAKDDSGAVIREVLVDEEATLKSGVMTWIAKTLQKLCNTGRVSEVGNIRTILIGGIKNNDNKKYIIHFVHEDKINGTSRVSIVGNNQAGFKMAYLKDKETVLDAEFKASPLDSTGTLIKYTEEIGILVIIAVTSVAGATTGKTKITTNNVLKGTNVYKYKTGATVTMPVYGESASSYTAWDGSADITATTGHEIVIVECTTGDIIVEAGKATVTSKA
jgi:hypothetical protein